MALYILHERVDWQDPNLSSNMQAIRKEKNNESVNAKLVSRAFSLLTFTSFNVKKKRSPGNEVILIETQDLKKYPNKGGKY